MTKQDLLRELEILTKAEPGSLDESTPIEGIKGWDSLKNMEFRLLVADELGQELDGLAVERSRTLGELIALVKNLDTQDA